MDLDGPSDDPKLSVTIFSVKDKPKNHKFFTVIVFFGLSLLCFCKNI